MSLVRRVTEPKLSKCGTFTSRTVKVGNKILGTIETPKLKPGVKSVAVYWAAQEVIKVSAARMFLSVNRVHIAGLRTYAVGQIGTRCADGTQYQIALDEVDAITQAGIVGKYLDIPASSWKIDLPPEEERVANTMAKMRLAGRGRKSIMSE